MKDFSFWKEYEGASEGSGRSEKIWLINPDTDQTGLFKLKKDKNTTDHVSECIAYDLAKLIDLPCARFEIGKYGKKEGSMSYNIVEKEKSSLIEGIYFIKLAYHSYNADQLFDLNSKEQYSLDMIKKSLEPFGLFDSFLSIPVFDFLIGNTDRHQNNWAFIMKDAKLELSPLYDNSSSLCAYVSDSQIDAYLGKDTLLWNSLLDSKSKSAIRITKNDIKRPTHLEMLQALQVNYYNQTYQLVDRIKSLVTEDVVCDIVDKYEEEIFSEKRKELLKKFILAKIEIMKNTYR